MFFVSIGILIRILSNSYLNVFQKVLTNLGQRSSVINFYTYLGLSIIGIFFICNINFNLELFCNFLIMGCLGALGNYFIIKALSIGELSSLAPINSYKPIVSMIFGFFLLKEIPSFEAILGILFIILGTYFIFGMQKNINKFAIFYRVLALIFSGTEAIFIKKIILSVGITNSFVLWSISGLIFSILFLIISKNKPVIKSYKYQFLLILAVGIMQYSTNFVFSKINVSYALALFQLSTILSVVLGVSLFKETRFKEKILGSLIMLLGAILIILK